MNGYKATQEVINKLRLKDYSRIPNEELREVEGYVRYDDPQLGIDVSEYNDCEDNIVYFRHIDRINGFNKNLEERTIEHRIQTEIVSAKDAVVVREKERLGRVGSEREWGQVEQMLKEAGATVPESKQLEYHIDKFMEHQQRRHATKKISAGRLGKIANTLKHYKEWTRITNVEKMGIHDKIFDTETPPSIEKYGQYSIIALSCNFEVGFNIRNRTMSQQQVPLTAEVVFEMFRETDRRIAQMSQETDRKFQETDRKIGSLTSRIGEIVENMVGGDIVGQFQALNIAIHSHCRDKTFGTRGTSESGQIDVFLENGDIVVLIEVKTKLTDDDVREHIERLEKYRRYGKDKRRIIGAVAGAVVSDDVIKFAHRQGLYVIVQSGVAVDIITSPEGFVAKEW